MTIFFSSPLTGYKYFVPLAFRIQRAGGVAGYLHPESVYEDPKCGRIRQEIYPRLRFHAQCVNALRLFDIDSKIIYGLNVYGDRQAKVCFQTMAKVYHPTTIDESLSRNSSDLPLPEERDGKGRLQLMGHPDRVVTVTDETLSIFAMVINLNSMILLILL